MIHYVDILKALMTKRFHLMDEKLVQSDIEYFLKERFPGLKMEREFHLDKDNHIDFLFEGRIGMEVKVKGRKRDIFRQCERYCEFDQIEVFVLFTGVSMGLPEEINGKSCYMIQFGRAWL